MARRPAIRKRADGRYTAWIYRPRGGRYSVYGRTAQDVERQIDLLYRSAGTVRDFCEQPQAGLGNRSYLGMLAQRVKPRTLATYTDAWRVHVMPVIGMVAIGEVTPSMVRQCFECQASAHLSPSRKNVIASFVRGLFKAAVESRLIDSSPVPELRFGRGPRKPRRDVVTRANTAMRALRGTPHEGPTFAMLVLGLRIGEALGLSPDDIDVDNGLVHVVRQRHRCGAVGSPKSGTGRTINCGPEIAGRLLGYADPGTKHPFVFSGSDGEPLRRSAYARALSRVVRDLSPHDLRHACGTVLAAASATVARDILGHSDLSVTNMYAHEDTAGQQAALRALAGVVQ